MNRITTARNVRRDEPAAKPMKKLTAKEAAEQLRNLSRQERVRIDAQLEHDHFGKAAEAVGCNEETVAKTWKKYRHLIGIVISGVVSNELTSRDL